MEDPQVLKTKGPYKKWSESESKMLVQLLVDAINYGFRDANGKFNKLTVETRILASLNQNLGINKTYKEYKNRMKILKGKYSNLANLLRFSSGFAWDSETKKFIAREEVWNNYLKAHPQKTHVRHESFEDFEDLKMIFGSNIATGKNDVRLRDAFDAYTYQVGDNEGNNDSNRVQLMDDIEGSTYEETYVHEFSSALEKRRGKNLPQRKKARTEKDGESKPKKNTLRTNQIMCGMLSKKFQIWTKIYVLGMKTGFMNMSIAERKGWIPKSRE